MDAGETAMPTPAYIKIEGQTQGNITADDWRKPIV
jgi:hypothetical protein